MVALPPGFPADLIGAFDVLKSRPHLGSDELKVLALIESAGEIFYVNMAKCARSAEAKKLLTRSSQEERGHAHRIQKAVRLLGDNSFSLPQHGENPFTATVPAEIQLSKEFLSSLEQGEYDGERVYEGWARTEPNAEVAKILRQNGAEETAHGKRIVEVMKLEQLA
jgi:rubrerythrin